MRAGKGWRSWNGQSRFEDSIGGGARLGFEALPERTDAAQEPFKVLEDASQRFASTFLDEINRVTKEGAFSFTRFADSVIQDLLRILQQQFLMPWLEKGIQAGLSIRRVSRRCSLHRRGRDAVPPVAWRDGHPGQRRPPEPWRHARR